MKIIQTIFKTNISDVELSFNKSKNIDLFVDILGNTYKVYNIIFSQKNDYIGISVGPTDATTNDHLIIDFVIRKIKTKHFSIMDFFNSLNNKSICNYELYQHDFYNCFSKQLKNSKLEVFEYTNNGFQINNNYYCDFHHMMYSNVEPEKLENLKNSNFISYLNNTAKIIEINEKYLTFGIYNCENYKNSMSSVFKLDYKSQWELSRMGFFWDIHKSLRIHIDDIFKDFSFKEKVTTIYKSSFEEKLNQLLIKDNQWNESFVTKDFMLTVQQFCLEIEKEFLENENILI